MKPASVKILTLSDEELEALLRRAAEAGARAALEETSVRADDQLTTEQAAEYLGTSTKTLIKRVKAGEIPARRIGRVYRFTRADLATAGTVVAS